MKMHVHELTESLRASAGRGHRGERHVVGQREFQATARTKSYEVERRKEKFSGAQMVLSSAAKRNAVDRGGVGSVAGWGKITSLRSMAGLQRDKRKPVAAAKRMGMREKIRGDEEKCTNTYGALYLHGGGGWLGVVEKKKKKHRMPHKEVL